jgi:hypothetical protein
MLGNMLSPKKIYNIYQKNLGRTMNHNELDALGNKLIIGNRYGYSQSHNGITRVVVGKLVKANKSNVTIEIIYAHDGHNYKPESDIKKNVSVRSVILFPCFNFKTEEEKQAEADSYAEWVSRNQQWP